MPEAVAVVRSDLDFCLEVGFERGSEGPARVFSAISELIGSFQAVDRILVRAVSGTIEPVLLLEDIEAGSIRVFIRDRLNETEDEALKKLDWKSIVGPYLVRAKYLVIKFLEGKSEISDRAEIIDVQGQLLTEAEKVDISPIQIHRPLPEADIANMLKLLSDPLAQLRQGDSAKYITAHDEARFNLGFSFAPQAIEELVTRETIVSSSVMILKIKRPDYLGFSMWEFRHDGHPMEAKILDSEWLEGFQQRKVELRPGDAIRALVESSVRYGYDGDVVAKHHAILKVLEKIPDNSQLRPYWIDPPS